MENPVVVIGCDGGAGGVGDDRRHVGEGDRFFDRCGPTTTAGRHLVHVHCRRLCGLSRARFRLFLRFLNQIHLAAPS
jgi:hypothetical protein